MVPSSLFTLASSVCKSLQYLTFTLTQGVEGGHLLRLTCSVVLQGGRNTANKYHWRVWGVLTVYGPHLVCPNSRRCVLPRSTLLRLQGALQGHYPKQAQHFLHFPGLSRSGSQELCKGTDSGSKESVSLWSTREPEPEWCRPGKCKQPRAHLDSFPTEKPGA